MEVSMSNGRSFPLYSLLFFFIASCGMPSTGISQKNTISLDQFRIETSHDTYDTSCGFSIHTIEIRCTDTTGDVVAVANITAYPINSIENMNHAKECRLPEAYHVLLEENQLKDLVYLGFFKIYKDCFKGKGLGGQFFNYVLKHVQSKYPQALYYWEAVPLDGENRREDLLRFYKKCGGIWVPSEPNCDRFYIDLATFYCR